MSPPRAEGDLGPVSLGSGERQSGELPASDPRSVQANRWVLGVSYCGTDFCGWQTQPAGATRLPALQDVLAEAIGAVAGHGVAVRCAGRTDAGVHAIEQIAQFDTTAQRPTGAWVRGVNAHLAMIAARAGRSTPGIAVRWARPVAGDFDARFSARARTYWYLLADLPVQPPLLAGRVGWTHRALDLPRMVEAAALLVGTHDFTSFRAAQCQAASPIRTVESFEIVREGRLILLRVTANAFLHHMVRNLVGALVMVGDGRRSAPWVSEVLAARDRSAAAPTFAAAGLYLASVRYDPVWSLPIQPRPLQLAELW